jgi:hypothetical protein
VHLAAVAGLPVAMVVFVGMVPFLGVMLEDIARALVARRRRMLERLVAFMVREIVRAVVLVLMTAAAVVVGWQTIEVTVLGHGLPDSA